MDPVTITQLWLPLLISSVVVFFASSIMWMVLPHHKPDIKFLGDKEKGYIDAINSLSIEPGLYMYPNCDQKDMGSDEFKARYKSGPWGLLTIAPAQPNFPMNLLKTFISFTAITFMVAYISSLAIDPGADYMHVFRVVGTTAILGHCMGALCGDFFLGKPTRFMVTSFIDGVVYALITAGIFASMWPSLQTDIPILITQ
jgi:hypothetical protein